MSSTSDPPNADAERRGPVSIMPATEGIDDEWGAEPEAAVQVVVPAPAKMPVIAQPKAEPVRVNKADPPQKKSESSSPKPAPSSPSPSPKPAPSPSPGPKAAPSPSPGPKAATSSPSPSPEAATSSASTPARSGRGGYVAVVALLAAAGIWWALRSPEPEHTNPAPVPVAVTPPPAASATPVPASADPIPLASAAPLATDLPSSSAEPVAAAFANCFLVRQADYNDGDPPR